MSSDDGVDVPGCRACKWTACDARRVRNAVAQATDRGILGENIFGSGFSFEIKVVRGAGSYVCGEESGLIASIEDGRGMRHYTQPFLLSFDKVQEMGSKLLEKDPGFFERETAAGTGSVAASSARTASTRWSCETMSLARMSLSPGLTSPRRRSRLIALSIVSAGSVANGIRQGSTPRIRRSVITSSSGIETMVVSSETSMV